MITNYRGLILANTMVWSETRMRFIAGNHRRFPVCLGQHRGIRLGHVRATSVAVLISCSSLASAKTDLKIPSIDADVSIDTTVTAGVGVRTTEADRRLIGKSFDSSGRPKGGIGTDVNDDGNLNYSKGDVFTAPVKAFSRLTMTHDAYRFVASARAWADAETLYGEVPQGNIPNGYRANARLSDRGLSHLNRFAGVRLWEAYASGKWDMSPSASVDATVGRSVLNWSISKSFNAQAAITPIDLTVARMPGVVARDEVAIPIGMLNLSATVDGVTVGGFYQFERRVDNLPACGTFFSALDVGFDAGCSGLAANTFFTTPASALSADAARYDNDAFGIAAGAVLPRVKNVYTGVHSQFGISAKFKPVAGLGVRIYFLNLASRLPYITAITGDVTAFQRPDPTFVAAGAPVDYAGTVSFLKTAGYRFDYPGNIRTFGANFTLTHGGNTVGAQVDFSDNLPVQLNTADVIEQIFGAGPLVPRVLGMPPGSFSNGYDRLRSLNLTVTASREFPQVLKAKLLKVSGEALLETLPGLPPLSTARYGRGFQYGFSREGFGDIASCPAIADPGSGNPAGCVNKGFVTSAAVGYRLNATLAYELGTLHLTPALAWAHDVSGYSPNGQLIKDRKIVRPSLEWEYGGPLFGGLSYTHDLKSSTYNNADDHDYVQAWIGLHF